MTKTRPSSPKMPDPSSAAAVGIAVAPRLPKLSETSDRPVLLPTDLPRALTWLTDQELTTLARALAAEQARRGPLTNGSSETDAAKAPPLSLVDPARPTRRNASKPQLTEAKMNAIVASLKAGIKPTVIARQFGVSLKAIRDAIKDKAK